MPRDRREIDPALRGADQSCAADLAEKLEIADAFNACRLNRLAAKSNKAGRLHSPD
jgi:hypothetical protein